MQSASRIAHETDDLTLAQVAAKWPANPVQFVSRQHDAPPPPSCA
jgi:hypothetical protein